MDDEFYILVPVKVKLRHKAVWDIKCPSLGEVERVILTGDQEDIESISGPTFIDALNKLCDMEDALDNERRMRFIKESKGY